MMMIDDEYEYEYGDDNHDDGDVRYDSDDKYG